MDLPLNAVRPTRLRELKSGGLCLSYDKRQFHVFVDLVGDRFTAIFLTGPYAFHAFGLDASHSWKALYVGMPTVVIDTTSAFDAEANPPPLGALIINDHGASIQVSMEDRSGFADRIELPLASDIEGVSPGLGVAFTKWTFKLGEGRTSQYFPIDVTPSESAQ